LFAPVRVHHDWIHDDLKMEHQRGLISKYDTIAARFAHVVAALSGM
jgi:hypothetical protein